MPGRQRQRLPWFPTIKCEDCLLDLECLSFCPADVFDWDSETGKPLVARPFDCIPGCRSCAENCKGKSISLPGKKEVAAALKKIRSEDRGPSVGNGVAGTSVGGTPVRRRNTPQRPSVRENKTNSKSSPSVIRFTTRRDKGPEQTLRTQTRPKQ